MLFINTPSTCSPLVIEICEELCTGNRMLNNYSYNNNCAIRATECAYSYDNSHHDISNLQVFVNDQIGSCNSNNIDNAKPSILVRILVVDDDPDINFIVDNIGKSKGIQS